MNKKSKKKLKGGVQLIGKLNNNDYGKFMENYMEKLKLQNTKPDVSPFITNYKNDIDDSIKFFGNLILVSSETFFSSSIIFTYWLSALWIRVAHFHNLWAEFILDLDLLHLYLLP